MLEASVKAMVNDCGKLQNPSLCPPVERKLKGILFSILPYSREYQLRKGTFLWELQFHVPQ